MPLDRVAATLSQERDRLGRGRWRTRSTDGVVTRSDVLRRRAPARRGRRAATRRTRRPRGGTPGRAPGPSWAWTTCCARSRLWPRPIRGVLSGRRGRARPAAGRARHRRGHRRRGRRHRLRRASSAARLKGHVRAHEKFGTAVSSSCRRGRDGAARGRRLDAHRVLRLPGARCPRSSTPASAATWRAATSPSTPWPCRSSRDDLGDLLDYFGGLDDLQARRIVVLHNLSFIEDPTRILRAIRYETRYGLRMDAHTLNLARACLRDGPGRRPLLGAPARRARGAARGGARGLRPAAHGGARLVAVDPRPPALGTHRARPGAARSTRCGRPTACRPRCRAGACASSGCCATWSPKSSPPGPSACASAVATPRCWRAASWSARRLSIAWRADPNEAELYEFAHGEPLEALVAAMVLDDSGAAAARLGRYLDVTRHVRLAISGDDLLELGYNASPAWARCCAACCTSSSTASFATARPSSPRRQGCDEQPL